MFHEFADLDLNATENFATLFGPTGTQTIFGQVLPRLTGFFDVTAAAPIISIEYGLNAITNDLRGASHTDIFFLDANPSGEAGSFLVRVPEPSLSLLSVGLIGLAAIVLRRNRNRVAGSNSQR